MKPFKMTRTALLGSFLLLFMYSNAQYKNDNLLFKTMYPGDLCKELKKYPGALLLDVRSPGEYNDTSSSTGLNIGHLKNALNVDVRKLPQQLHSLAAYKDKQVFVYCSHSQRSRRASKMLADSGFLHIFNINGGMTAIYYTNARETGCLQSLVETNNKYSVISPNQLCQKISSNSKKIFLLDVR